jgi:alkylation response protein AidB-like acyl-CoA dehydrogenase
MRRTLFEAEHEAFRDSVRRFLEKEVAPHQADWDTAGIAPREIFATAGNSGFLGFSVPEEFGGGGTTDFRFNAVLIEEIHRADAASVGLGFTLQTDITLPYFLHLTNDEQKTRWLPKIASGDYITAIAMTEPGIGSDLAGLNTTAIRNGDHYLVNGAKTFITNGINADLIVTAVKTDPTQRHAGVSLIVLERGMPGFERGRNLDKLGLHGQDTAELSFTDVRVPVENRLGEEGQGFKYLVTNLPQERLSIACAAIAAATCAFEMTLAYVKERKAFGQPIGSFQNTKFVLAELATEISIGQQYLDNCITAHNQGELTAAEASAAKWWCTELQGRTVDKCVQLHGGYGYMTEHPITRAYANARITRIYGGTTEIMKEVVGRSLGL